MRHRVAKKILQRDESHRKSMLKNLSTDLVIHEKVVTTISKAKYLRPHIEKLITKAKRGQDFNNVKYMKGRLAKNEAVRKILSDLGPRFKKRPGGYTRIIRLEHRKGDHAPMARIELVETAKAKKKAVKKEEEAETKTGEAKETKKKTVKKSTIVLRKRGKPKKEQPE